MDTSPLKCNAPTVLRARGQCDVSASVVLHGHGSFNKIKVVGAPLPTRIEDNHVKVEVYYCGLNFTDNYLRLGIIRSDKFPVIMGSECVGVILGVGSGVTDLKVGQRVLCLRMQGGLFRHFVHVPRSNCFLLPDEMTMVEAVSIGLDFLVAHLCLFEVGHVKDTDRIFVQSIAGGVGISMVQLARALVGDNVKIFGTAGDRKHDDVLHLGANRVYSHEEDYVREIMQEYHGGVDIAINSNGGSDITKCLKLLRPFGRLINIGSNSTAIYPRSALWGMIAPTWDTKCMTPGEILDSNRKITGVNIGDLMQAYPQRVESIVEEMFQLFCSKKIEPRVHEVVPFEKVAEGIRKMCARENTGKVVMFVQHQVHRTAVPRCRVSPIVAVTSESPSHEKEGSQSCPHEDLEESAAQAEPCTEEAEDAGKERRDSCLTEEDLGIEEGVEEEVGGEQEQDEQGEEEKGNGQEDEKEEEENGNGQDNEDESGSGKDDGSASASGGSGKDDGSVSGGSGKDDGSASGGSGKDDEDGNRNGQDEEEDNGNGQQEEEDDDYGKEEY